MIYVDGKPFTARRSAMLNENDLVPGITGHRVQILETSMKNSLQEQLEKENNHFSYWHEVALHENELVESKVSPDQVFTLPEMYQHDEVRLADSRIESVSYHRIPIERENAPEHADVELIMELVRSAVPILRTATSDTAFVFNCQMGKRRTTTALVISSLIWQRPHINLDEIPSEPDEAIGTENGNFAVIREVQNRLPFGHQSKWWVDKTIDECAAICNIRAVINKYHDLSNNEAKPAKRTYYLVRCMFLRTADDCLFFFLVFSCIVM